MDSQKLLLPGSILLAGALMGAGLYFGLSAQRQGAVPAPPGEPAPQGERPLSSPDRRVDPAPGQPPVEPAAQRPLEHPIPLEVRIAATKQAADALAAHRPRLVKECWEPSVKKAAAPPKVTIPIRFLFDAQGKETSRGIGDAAEPGREDVVACVRAATFPISILPPGQIVGAQLALMMP